MKTILITAAVVGAAGAGVILYLQKKNPELYNELTDSAKDAWDNVLSMIGKIKPAANGTTGA